ncbi:MAG: hypothetical protein HYU39_08145 [Thaumarchaeota archaeon]|nr:hypothetical protein [Nitrososphaerota archaeon]
MDWGLFLPALVMMTLGLTGLWIVESEIGVFPELVGPSMFMFFIGAVFMVPAIFKDGFPALTSRGKAIVGTAIFIALAEIIAFLIAVA